MRLHKTEQKIRAIVKDQLNGDDLAAFQAKVTLTVPWYARVAKRRAVRLWLDSAPDYELSIQTKKPPFSNTWEITLVGCGRSMLRWLSRGWKL